MSGLQAHPGQLGGYAPSGGGSFSANANSKQAQPVLPSWVYDLLIDLLEQQDVHPKLFYTSGAFEGHAQYDWCPCAALKHAPADVIERAQAIRAYKQQTQSEEAG